MGVIMKNKVNYTGGGGSGGASALADLEDVELTTPIDGQALVYDAENDLWINGGVVGSGGGSAKYTEKELWSGTQSSAGSINLAESIESYQMIIFIYTAQSGVGMEGSSVRLVSDIVYGRGYHFTFAEYVVSDLNYYFSGHFDDATTFTIDERGNTGRAAVTLKKIIGIKWETMQTTLIYSEEEREVGVWIDNKPLYQKTIVYTPSGTITSDIILPTVANAEKMMIVSAFTHKNADNRGYFIPYRNGNPLMCMINYNNGVPVLAIRNDSWDSNWTFYITVQYTKTTDVPGSAIWTTTGEYAHHYSTTEHVIGTWIDGKTLYERTIFTNPTWSNNSASIPLTNEICKNIEGGVCDANGENLIPFGYGSINEYVRLYQAGNILSLYNSFTSSRAYVQITIRYTKSS